MKKMTKLLALGLAATMTAGLAGCGTESQAATPSSLADTAKSSQAEDSTVSQTTSSEVSSTASQTDDATKIHKIGVAVYNLNDDEVKMFRSYYEDYLTAAFNVDFLYSDTITTIDDEKSFVDQAREAGCEGIISYVSYDLPEITAYCADDMYYAIASGTFTEEEFAQASQHEKFLGITGPSEEDEYTAGKNLVDALAKDDDDLTATQKSWLLCSGGSASGNYMHSQRLAGALDELQSLGYTLTASVDEIKAMTASAQIATHPDGGSVTLLPGYYFETSDQLNFTQALDTMEPDIVVSVCTLSNMYPNLLNKERQQGKNIEIGAVDAFTDTNREAFEAKDSFGNSQIDCIVGKCRAMGAPAFIAMYNAVTGHADVVRDNGAAYHLSQDMWTAATPEEYEELSTKASNIYQNVYSTEEMMQVLGVFNPEADFASFTAFVDKL